jgi:hypothetical protein
MAQAERYISTGRYDEAFVAMDTARRELVASPSVPPSVWDRWMRIQRSLDRAHRGVAGFGYAGCHCRPGRR